MGVTAPLGWKGATIIIVHCLDPECVFSVQPEIIVGFVRVGHGGESGARKLVQRMKRGYVV